MPGQGRLLARVGLGVLGVLIALVTTALTPALALADTKVWLGVGSDANWMTPGNWAPGIGGQVAPVAGDALVFPNGAIQLTNTNNFPNGTSFGAIAITGSGYTLNGNAVNIATFGSITASYPSGTTATINLPVAGFSWDINVSPGATLVFGGNLTNASNKVGAGTAVLLGSSNGVWNIVAGTLNIQNGGALGTGAAIQVGGTLQLQGGITVPTHINVNGGTGAADTTGAVQSVSGNNTLTGGMEIVDNTMVTADAGSTLTISTGNLTFAGSNRTLTLNAGGPVTITSVVTNGPGWGLTKTGVDTLTLSANNTYTGPTTVSAGTLLVNGSQPASSVTVASGATLGGTGTTGPVTVNGILSPGAGGPGVLHTGNTTFNAGSTFAVELNGTTVGSGYDELFATGTVTLSGPTLAVSVGFPSAPGNAFTILQSTGTLSGGFLGLAEGSTFLSGGRTFRINYTTNAVTLTDVSPAPAPTFTPTPTATPTITPTATPTCILGDINCDGIVDIRDYGLWRQNFGQTNCGNPADLDGNCVVDIRDYGIWRQNFGHTSGAARRGETAPAPRSTPGPALLRSDQAARGSWAPFESGGADPAVPIVPLVGGLLGIGGLAGWRRRRPRT